MREKGKPLLKLQGLATVLQEGSFDDNMQELAAIAAKVLNAENCSLMLLTDDETESPCMRVSGSHGPLPAEAYKESARAGQGIAGRVVASGKALLIRDVEQSEFAACARRPDDPRKSLLSSPLAINGRIIGVINVSGHLDDQPFGKKDLNLLEVVALFVGKAIQVVQLQNMLKSRFAQLALMEFAEKDMGSALASAVQNPDRVARILAKAFYKEMTRAGFGSNQIINAASEIVGQLSGSLSRHSKRIEQKTTE
ncbi:MAG: GAF domain-containing protein [Candidatus Accumulibacter sp.]|uniref:GAF domain-containing protein n=1 Tax=Accumulibacter sp. TaxID=2053492 RepID=UPI0025CC6453|nr:GAF domain-containing protein [Accumulibacter sp.]MCP5249327.1 GAF domain-containing protein [Accumulibacter sp.]